MQLAQNKISPILIRHGHFPPDIISWLIGTNGFDHRIACEDHFIAFAFPGAIARCEIRRGPWSVERRITPMHNRRRELPVIAQRLAVRDRVVPDKPGRRVGNCVGFVGAHAIRITARPACERFFQIIGAERGGGPLMAVGTEDAGAISIIEEGKLADHLVLIGSDPLAEDAKRCIAVAARIIAQNLIIRAIFFNHVNDVFEHARLADPLRYRPRRFCRTWR